MADIRPPVQGAGKRRLALGVAWAATWVSACTPLTPPPRPEDPALASRNALPPSPEPSILTPVRMLLGGRVAAIDPTGMPRPGTAAGYRSFQFPSAVAARGPDLYIVDSGRQEIVRFDTMQQVISTPTGLRASIQTRLRVGGDGSLYVLDPAASTIQRFTRSGQRLSVYADKLNLTRPVDFVVDETRGRVFAADATYQQLLAFHPDGLAAYVILGVAGERGPIRAVAGLALAPGGVIVSDSACGCLVEFSPETGRAIDFGHDALRQPGALAVDRYGRIYVMDAGDRRLKVFRGRRLVASLGYANLGLISPTSIAADESTLYVADGPASRVALFRISPPGKGEER